MFWKQDLGQFFLFLLPRPAFCNLSIAGPPVGDRLFPRQLAVLAAAEFGLF
jgi:hypothetical protein